MGIICNKRKKTSLEHVTLGAWCDLAVPGFGGVSKSCTSDQSNLSCGENEILSLKRD